MPAYNSGVPWDEDDDRRLIRLESEGYTMHYIASELGRSQMACKRRLEKVRDWYSNSSDDENEESDDDDDDTNESDDGYGYCDQQTRNNGGNAAWSSEEDALLKRIIMNAPAQNLPSFSGITVAFNNEVQKTRSRDGSAQQRSEAAVKSRLIQIKVVESPEQFLKRVFGNDSLKRANRVFTRDSCYEKGCAWDNNQTDHLIDLLDQYMDLDSDDSECEWEDSEEEMDDGYSPHTSHKDNSLGARFLVRICREMSRPPNEIAEQMDVVGIVRGRIAEARDRLRCAAGLPEEIFHYDFTANAFNGRQALTVEEVPRGGGGQPKTSNANSSAATASSNTHHAEPLCDVCLFTPKKVAFIPCGHRSCAACVTKLNAQCHICRARIKSTLTIF